MQNTARTHCFTPYLDFNKFNNNNTRSACYN